MDNRKFLKGFISGILSACVIILIVLLGAGVLGNTSILGTDLKITSEDSEEGVTSTDVWNKIAGIKQIIDTYYLDYQEDVEDQDLIDGLYKGLLEGLNDPYSVYYTVDEYNSMLESTNGVYYGIGVVVSQDPDTGLITLVKPYESGPGYEAGILPGDVLYKVNDTEVSGMDLNNVVSMIKGEEGTTVHLTIYREGESDYIDLDVVRKKIEVPTVSYEMMDDQIGYIQILEFDEITSTQFSEALSDLQSQGMQALVVDLRDNPGGRLDVVNSILDEILPEGLIVYTQDKNGEKEEYTSDAEHYLDIPLSVLINVNSASASEIFAGAIKDYGIGTLVGTTSFGKGIVQRLIDLGDGSAIKLTIEKYYTPNGNNIQGTGIEPDVTIDLTDELKTQVTISKEEDNQLQKAVEVVKEKLND